MSQLTISFLEAGFTKHIEAVSYKGGGFKSIRFPATVAVFEHPKNGVTLFDTGYSPRFYEQTKYFPNKFYSLVTPVTIDPEQTAVSQLKKRGISPSDVKKVILSHFHADHVAGVIDFPQAEYVYRKSAYDAVKNLGAWGAVKAAFLKGLLPSDFSARSKALEDHQFLDPLESAAGFQFGHDLFGDKSLTLVDLPGHATGHLGVFATDKTGRRFFLVGDACWSCDAYQNVTPPHGITKLLFSNWNDYTSTLKQINQVYQKETDVTIVPCHCEKTLDQLKLSSHSA